MGEQAAFTLDWQALAGSGFVSGVLFLALVERLRHTFATRQELNGLGQKFNALETLFIQVREVADEAHASASAVRAEQKHQWERITEQVIRPLERITDKLEAVGEAQAAQSSTLDHIVGRLNRADVHSPPRKRQP